MRDVGWRSLGPSSALVAGSRSGLGFVMWPLVTLSRRSRGGIALVNGCGDVILDAIQILAMFLCVG